MKRAIIFDFGGVIMKTRDYNPRLAWDTRLKLAPGSVEAVVHRSESWRLAQTGQISVEAYWDSVAKQLGLSAVECHQLAEDFYSGDALDQQILDLIEQLREQGHTIALLSNDSPALEAKLRQLDLYRLFDTVVISGLIGVMKPEPAAYKAALTALARPANECVFIDDMRANIDGANALGIQTVHYSDGLDLAAALAPLLIMAHS